jgi:hypothetical protein
VITLLEHARHRLIDQSLVEGAGRARRPTAIRELSRRSTLLKHLNGLISCAPAFQVTSIEECRTEAESRGIRNCLKKQPLSVYESGSSPTHSHNLRL